MFPLFHLLFLLSSFPLLIYGQCILLDEQFATTKTQSTAIIAARRMKRATMAFANENNFVQILPPLGQLQKHRRVKRTGFPPPVVPVVPPAPAPAAPVPAQQFPAPSESFFPVDFPAPAPAPSQSFFDSNANNQIQPQFQPAQFHSQSNSFSFPSSQSESAAQFQPPQLPLPQPESAVVPQPNFEPPPAPIIPSSEFVPPIQPEPESEFPLPPPPQQQFPSSPPPSLPPQTTFLPPATSPLPMPTTTSQQSRCELLRYPLPECYTDDSNMMCCNPELEDTMMDAFHQLVQQEGEDEFHRCNIQMIANRVQMMSEAKFNTTFEVITGIGDYASRSHFWHNYICKIERDGRFILAYATPKGNSATGAVEGNTGGGGEGDEAENGQGGEEEMANYDGEEEGANGGGGMDSESVIHAKRRGPNQGILNMFLTLRRRRNEDGKRNKTMAI